ncbi:MAG: cytochrome P460 family protein [Rhodospirillales bacterium]|nr:MAG: cytochrome P460 family protein [Rhodospirillales bacterium]
MPLHRQSARTVSAIPAVLLCASIGLVVTAMCSGAWGQQNSAPLATPKSHFKVERPADMLPDTAETLYQNIRAEMAAGYALARLPELRNYLSWRRFNKAPYRSATHGARYVNNYANSVGEAYGAFERAGRLPEGAILVKDSFTATVNGGIFPGPMFVMEKMAVGFSPESGDWRYRMIMPDGSLFGETNGVNSDSVAFCIGCHATRAGTDHLFFLPKDYRLRPFEANH